MTDEKLLNIARKALNNAYSPYSNYKVGCALMCKDNSIYTGVNVENASFGATICAERVAITKAISDGKKDFEKIAISAKQEEKTVKFMPCGICRQVLSEFCDENFKLIIDDDKPIITTLSKIYPMSFKIKDE